MAQRRKNKQKKQKSSRPAEVPLQRSTGETPAADALTVAWMLCALSTLLASLALVLVESFLTGDGQVAPPGIQALHVLLGFSAVTIGIIGLVFTPLVYRVRRVPPPRNITIAAVTICSLPIWVALVRAM